MFQCLLRAKAASTSVLHPSQALVDKGELVNELPGQSLN